MTVDRYTGGDYLRAHPTWHVEDSAWKAAHVARLLERHAIRPARVGEIGCGAGEILRQLQSWLGVECEFWGYDVSPQAIELAQPRANQKLHFVLGDIRSLEVPSFDVLLVIDLIEHLEDYFGFLRHIRWRGRYKVFHIPLDLSVQSVLRGRLTAYRSDVGHLHYFTKETALQTLHDTGYHVVDVGYTASAVDLPARSRLSYLAKLLRRLATAVHPDLSARVLGGYSLMVLAE